MPCLCVLRVEHPAADEATLSMKGHWQMTRKDFELIARTISEYPEDRNFTIVHHCGKDAHIPNVHIRDLLAELFADALADTNPRFDRAGFIEACTR